jgi:RimJ/RimL family protein N-acetyltransferase
MGNIFSDNFEIKYKLFNFKYITDLDIFSLREYYLRNLLNFQNASPKRNVDFFDIENLTKLLEYENSQRLIKKDLRLYLFEDKKSNLKFDLLSKSKDIIQPNLDIDIINDLPIYDKIIGDIALYDINIEKKYCAISYQIDFEYQKKGLMSLFIQELFSYIEKLNGDNLNFLKQIFSFVPFDNFNSQKFCVKNGFELFDIAENYAEINGEVKNHFVYVKNFDL